MRFKKREISAEIFTGSMADVTFLLIVYFMVTTTFTATRGLDFALPKEDDAPPVVEKEESVLIEIRPDGSLVVDQRPMPLEDIVDYLAPKLERNPLKPVIIQPDPQSPYHYMVDVFDELRRGKDKMGLKKDINISIPTRREIEQFWY